MTFDLVDEEGNEYEWGSPVQLPLTDKEIARREWNVAMGIPNSVPFHFYPLIKKEKKTNEPK